MLRSQFPAQNPQTITEFCKQHPDRTLWQEEITNILCNYLPICLTKRHNQNEDLFNFILLNEFIQQPNMTLRSNQIH